MHLSNWARRVLLFAEAGVCFGPLGLLCLLGVVALPMWIKLLLIEITGRVDMHNSGGTSAIVWPIVFVLTGIAGLTGLVRLIPVLSGGPSTSRDILLTRAMVFIGLFGLATFLFYPGALPDNTGAWLVYFVLPGLSTAHLLFLGRRCLFTPSAGVS